MSFVINLIYPTYPPPSDIFGLAGHAGDAGASTGDFCISFDNG